MYVCVGVSLYDWSGVGLDDQSLQLLHHHDTILANMVTVFQALLAHGSSATLQGDTMMPTSLTGPQ